jgi:hypothetical protein
MKVTESVHFENIEEVILRKMQGYSHALVASAWLTSARIIRRLESMDARVIVSDKTKHPHDKWHVVKSSRTNMMHHKFMILGDGCNWMEVINGSYNFTENAIGNAENITISSNPKLIDSFVKEFEKTIKPLVGIQTHVDDMCPYDDFCGIWVPSLSMHITQWDPWDYIWDTDITDDLFYFEDAMDRKNAGGPTRDPHADDFLDSLWSVARAINGKDMHPRQACWAWFNKDVTPHHTALIVKDDNNGSTWTASERPIKGSDVIQTVRQIYQWGDGYYCPFEPPAPIEQVEVNVCFDKRMTERQFLHKVRFGTHWIRSTDISPADVAGHTRVSIDELGPRTITYKGPE